jgi:septal ring factor EnvC (AmiA/AmiB activator)
LARSPIWWTWLLAGLALALFAIIADWLRQRNEKRERAQERAQDLSETRGFVQQAQDAIQKEVHGLKADIATIALKPEAAEKKLEEISQRIADWNPSTSAAQIWHTQQMARTQQLMRNRRNILAAAGAWVDAQKGSSEDDPKK